MHKEDGSLILSGMRATGHLHLGHYYGVIKNWVELQYSHEAYFMVADLHALTTGYMDTSSLCDNVYSMVVDWLACGVDPSQATIFVQSRIPFHAELYTLLSMIAPVGWLERVPTYKEQLDRLRHKEIDTLGFLGYPVLQAADILLYNATHVPVGEDQACHIEFTREIARRFNYLYGREEGFEEAAIEIVKKLGPKRSALYNELRIKYQQNGDDEALEQARFVLREANNLSYDETERLFAFLENKSRVLLTEPQALLTDCPKLLGLDGQKMSKSYCNTISLREQPEQISIKIKEMRTDPNRIRRYDPGDPSKCPVWQLHQVYSSEDVLDWVESGCVNATIGCLECKQPLIDEICKQQNTFNNTAKTYLDDFNVINKIIADGCEKAYEVAEKTMIKVKDAMGLS